MSLLRRWSNQQPNLISATSAGPGHEFFLGRGQVREVFLVTVAHDLPSRSAKADLSASGVGRPARKLLIEKRTDDL